MLPRHRHVIIQATLFLVVVWALAIGGYQLAGHSRMSVAKLRRYIASVNPVPLSAEERRNAVDQLVLRLNTLTADEQHLARVEQPWMRWFPALSVNQKEDLIGATQPADIQNMLSAFGYLPDDLQTRALAEAAKRLHTDQAQFATNAIADDITIAMAGTNTITDSTLQTMQQAGLQDYYTLSTARVKAVLAPLLEELHQMMETGDLFHRLRNNDFHREAVPTK